MGGTRGLRGKQGVRGATGPRGETGARGPVGPTVSQADILAAVANQFADVSQRLDTQLTRIAQLQEQLDRGHKELAEVRSVLGGINEVLQRLIKGG